MRTLVGWTTVILGVVMFGIGIRYHSTLWAGYRTETVVKEIIKTIPESPKDAPVTIPAEQLDKGQLTTGALKIQETYENTINGKGNGISTGDYQVMDVNKKVWMLKLCQPKSGIPVSFKRNSWVNIVYTKEEDCYRFVSATLLKEPPE